MLRTLAAAALLGFGIAHGAAAASPAAWRSLGPDGATIVSLVVDPDRPGTAHLLTDTGLVFSTRDGGNAWTSLTARPFNYQRTGLVVVNHGRGLLYGYGIGPVLRTRNAGRTWQHAGQFSGFPLSATVVRGNPTSLFIGSLDGTVVATTVMSHRWQTRSDGLPGTAVRSVASAESSGTLYAATDSGLFCSSDLGRSWRASGGFALARFVAVVRVGDSDVAYADTPLGLERSVDDGATWTPAHDGFDPNGGSVVALVTDGSRTGRLYALTSDGAAQSRVYTSGDGVAWAPVSTPPVTATTLVGLGTSPPILLLGTRCAGVFRTVDGGQTWSAANGGLRAINATEVVRAPGRLYAATDCGVVRSTGAPDDEAWESWSEGASDPADVFGLAVDATTSPAVVYGIGDGFLRRAEDAASWETMPAPSAIAQIAIDSSTTPGTIYVATRDGVYGSADRGGSWFAVGEFEDEVEYVAVDDSVRPSRLYANTTEQVLTTGTDAIAWTQIGGALDTSSRSIEICGLAPLGGGSRALLAAQCAQGVLRATPALPAWFPFGPSLVPLVRQLADYEPPQIAVDRSSGTPFVYATMGGAVLLGRAVSGGRWRPVGGRVPNGVEIQGVLASEGRVYVATGGRGIFTLASDR